MEPDLLQELRETAHHLTVQSQMLETEVGAERLAPLRGSIARLSRLLVEVSLAPHSSPEASAVPADPTPRSVELL